MKLQANHTWVNMAKLYARTRARTFEYREERRNISAIGSVSGNKKRIAHASCNAYFTHQTFKNQMTANW